MTVVRNIQTGIDYPDFNAALAALPSGPWTTEYELKQMATATYTTKVEVTSSVVSSTGPSEATPLIINGNDLAIFSVPASNDYNMIVAGLDYITIKQAAFFSSATGAPDTQLRLGFSGDNVNNISVEGCSFLSVAGSAHGIYIYSNPTASSNITITGVSTSAQRRTMSSASSSPVIYARNASNITVKNYDITQTGQNDTGTIETEDVTNLTIDAVEFERTEGRALLCDDTSLTVFNSTFVACNRNASASLTSREFIKLESSAVPRNQFDIYNNTFKLELGGISTDPTHLDYVIQMDNVQAASYLRNNIYFMDDISAPGPFYVYYFNTSASQDYVTSTGNCFYLEDANARLGFNLDTVTSYADLAVWQATGEDATSSEPGVPGSVEADPAFTTALSLELSDTSPAIDIGFNTGLTSDLGGDDRRVIGLLPDAGALENQTKARGVTFTPNAVENNGGYEVTVAGLTLADGGYVFSVGPYGDDNTKTPCYGGSFGNGNTTTLSDGSGTFVSPPLPSGGVYPMTIVSNATSLSYFVPSGISAVYKNHQSETFTLRNVLLPWWLTGPRKIDDEDPQT